MSKHDFTTAEFSDRLRRTREAIRVAGLDWLVVIHPSHIHWLTGSDAKSYQEFQCLLVGARSEPLSVLTRNGEVHEFETDSLADDVTGYGGGEHEDPVAAFAMLADRHGLRGARVGREVPGAWLGTSLVAEPTELIANLKLVKSPAELDCVRKAAAIADLGMDRFARDLAAGRSPSAASATSTRSAHAVLIGGAPPRRREPRGPTCGGSEDSRRRTTVRHP